MGKADGCIDLKGRHYLGMEDLDLEETRAVLELADVLKRDRREAWPRSLMAGRVIALIFEKASTRTRPSFEAGMAQMGGHAIFLSPDNSQLGRGEPVCDTARVLARYCDAIVARVYSHSTLEELRSFSTVPVISGLCDREHPCQILGDLMTIREIRGRLEGLRVAFIGDGNNIAHSLMLGCAMFGIHFSIACPEGYEPFPEIVERARRKAGAWGSTVEVVRDPVEAVRDADIVYTDVWASMGQEAEAAKRQVAFRGYVVDATLLARAGADVRVMHCLPAHRGEEIAADVMEGTASIIFQQAENRLHVQKSLLLHLIQGSTPEARGRA